MNCVQFSWNFSDKLIEIAKIYAKKNIVDGIIVDGCLVFHKNKNT